VEVVAEIIPPGSNVVTIANTRPIRTNPSGSPEAVAAFDCPRILELATNTNKDQPAGWAPRVFYLAKIRGMPDLFPFWNSTRFVCFRFR
jgi:hypothetical protein